MLQDFNDISQSTKVDTKGVKKVKSKKPSRRQRKAERFKMLTQRLAEAEEENQRLQEILKDAGIEVPDAGQMEVTIKEEEGDMEMQVMIKEEKEDIEMPD